MLRRLLAERRIRPLAASVPLALCIALILPAATPAGAVPALPANAVLAPLVVDSRVPLVPLAPLSAPATGGSALPPKTRAALDDRVAALGEGVDFGIAVQDLRTGTTYSHNGRDRFPSASVAKLTVLTMLHLSADEEGRELTATELAQVEQMIRFSDNEVTDGLYLRMGFTDGFLRHARSLGFTGTEPHPGGSWGATMTTPSDQIRLLRALYTDEGPLTEEDRAHVRELMESVGPDQAWGVSAVATGGDTVGLKNGWTPRESNGGLWIMNSVGYVAGPEHEYLIAVMSDHNTDYATGITLLEDLVTEVVEAIEGPGAHDDHVAVGTTSH